MKIFFYIWIAAATFAHLSALVLGSPLASTFVFWVAWTMIPSCILSEWDRFEYWFEEHQQAVRGILISIAIGGAAFVALGAFWMNYSLFFPNKSHTMTADEFLDAPMTEAEIAAQLATIAQRSYQKQPAAQQVAPRNPAPALISPQDRILIRTYPASVNQTRRAEPVATSGATPASP
jgi:hypothetical protein